MDVLVTDIWEYHHIVLMRLYPPLEVEAKPRKAQNSFYLNKHNNCWRSTTINSVQIVDFGTYGNGNIYITLDKTIDEPGCPSIYMELPADGPATKNVYTILAIAFTSGAKVNIKTDGCYNGIPSFTGARNTIFTLRKP